MSLHAIAKSVGVSKSTVSRVLNDAPGVRPEVAAAVRERMQHVGYQPSARRRGPKPLSRRGIRTGNVLLLMLGYTAAELYRMPVLPDLLHGAETSARQAGLNLLIASSEPNGVIPAALAPGQVDGVLLLARAMTPSPSLLARLEHLPVVTLMRNPVRLNHPSDCVLYNNPAVGQTAARHLLRRGHKRVAFINTAPRHDAFLQRQATFTAAIREGGGEVVEFFSDPAHNGFPTKEAVREVVDAFATTKPRPTSIFVPTDAILPPLYEELTGRGIMPGRDVDIVSCDNESQFLDRLHPRPTTIDINLHLVAKRGVEQLLWRIANPDEENRITVLIEPRLVAPA